MPTGNLITLDVKNFVLKNTHVFTPQHKNTAGEVLFIFQVSVRKKLNTLKRNKPNFQKNAYNETSHFCLAYEIENKTHIHSKDKI